MKNLKQHHSFGFEAYAQNIFSIDNLEDLNRIREDSLIIGAGTNIAFIEDIPQDVHIMALKGIKVSEDDSRYIVNVSAGENWHDFVTTMLEQNINGLENLALIPGSVGAAPVQNIGAYGVEVSDFVTKVRCWDVRAKSFVSLSNDDCQFGYRDSVFKTPVGKKLVITEVELTMPKGWAPNIKYRGLDTLNPLSTAKDIYQLVINIRESKLPDHTKVGNAGSFFKNPVVDVKRFLELKDRYPNIVGFEIGDGNRKIPAAWLIEQCGFKGKSFGGIGCYFKQPLVLINQSNGTGQELLAFAREIRTSVQQKFGISLENEVQLMGHAGRLAL